MYNETFYRKTKKLFVSRFFINLIKKQKLILPPEV